MMIALVAIKKYREKSMKKNPERRLCQFAMNKDTFVKLELLCTYYECNKKDLLNKLINSEYAKKNKSLAASLFEK